MTDGEKLDLILSKLDIVDSLNADMQEMKADMKDVKADISDLKNRVTTMENDIDILKIKVTKMEDDINELKARTGKIEDDITILKIKFDKIEEVGLIKTRIANSELHLESYISKNIQLLAENHINLIDKLNKAVPAADKSLAYEVKVNFLLEDVEKLKKKVEKLTEQSA